MIIFFMHTCVCAHAHLYDVGDRGKHWVSFSMVSTLFFEVHSFTEPGTHCFRSLTGQQAPRIYLFLPPHNAGGTDVCPLTYFYMCIGDLNPGPHACTPYFLRSHPLQVPRTISYFSIHIILGTETQNSTSALKGEKPPL